ncbi:PREDICTED: complement receptor type 1-like, partial [Mesitornis unicolor]
MEESLRWLGQVLAVVVLVLRPVMSLEMQCPVPSIPHGQLTPAQNLTYGSTAMLQCDAGYIPVGATTTLRCLGGGRWHPRLPACVLEVQCPSPVIPNGRVVSPRKAEYTFGHHMEFQCDHGYVLRGSQRIQCWSDGTWRPPMPYCDKVCGPPPKITNGHHASLTTEQHSGLRAEQFPYGSVIKYSCMEGLSLIGDNAIYCTSDDGENLVWSGPAPQCRVVRCPKPVVASGRMAPQGLTFPYGAKREGDADVCEEVLYIKMVSECGVPREEIKNLLEIQKLFLEIKKLKVELENLTKPSSDERASSFPVGSRVMYTCIDGAIKIPGRSDTVECLPGPRWSKLPEPCGRSCTAPTRLRFAALSVVDERTNFFPVGTNVRYVCRPGYENTSESSPTSTCLENLVWSEAAELCMRRSCGEPAALPGGRTGVLTDLRFGARVSVFCENG